MRRRFRSSRAATAPDCPAARFRALTACLIGLSRLNRIIDVDIPNQRITVEPGVINLDVTRRVAPHGYYYAPDPSSQLICSIGGNVAENSGGAHCLKYGFTVHHVLGVEAVLPNGEMIHLGGPALDAPGIDVLGALVGSEGTLAVVTKVTLRIVRVAETVKTILAAFASTEAAGAAVSEIISAGIIPAAVEMMDRLTIEAAEAAVHPNFPKAEAVLIVELDGAQSEVDGLFELVEAICYRTGGTEILIARNNDERARIWKGRKAAFAAMGRVSPNYYVQDGVIPRTKLGEVLAPHSRARRAFGVAHRQRVPCGRRQPSPAHLLRRAGARAGGARRESRLGNPDVLHRGRRIDHRRARRRRRQVGVDGEDVFGSRSRHDAAAARRIRPGRHL